MIGIDVGGTWLSTALVEGSGNILHLWREATPADQGAQAIVQWVTKAVAEAKAYACEEYEQTPAGIGIGFGGPVDRSTGLVRSSHHVAGWEGIALGDLLQEATGLPTFLENDANAGGLGEALFGVGQGADSLLYVNIGTGIGGAVIINDRIHDGAHSNAGEIGHVVIDPQHEAVCTCGKHGCLEALTSGNALGQAARRRLADQPNLDSTLTLLPLEEITGNQVGAAAQEGDPLALDIVRQAAEYLGLALAGAANVLDPELIVVGGGVAELGEVLLQPTREAFARYATPPLSADTPIVAAQLGYNAGVIGAAAVALVELELR